VQAVADAFLQFVDASGDGRLLDIDAYLRTKPRVVRWQFLCSLAGRRRIGFKRSSPSSAKSAGTTTSGWPNTRER
jgi:hypothetical protein